MKWISWVLFTFLAACGLGNTPTPEGTTTSWTYTSATAPGIASGKPSAGTSATRDATFTTPEGVVVSFHATAGGLDFERNGKPEHGDVPLTIKKGIFSSDITEDYDVDVFGDARIEETHSTAPPVLKKS